MFHTTYTHRFDTKQLRNCRRPSDVEECETLGTHETSVDINLTDMKRGSSLVACQSGQMGIGAIPSLTSMACKEGEPVEGPEDGVMRFTTICRCETFTCSEEGSYLRLIDFCITQQFKAHRLLYHSTRLERHLCKDLQRFRGGLVFKARNSFYHSTLGRE